MEHITPEECEVNAARCRVDFDAQWRRAAATIRELQAALHAANSSLNEAITYHDDAQRERDAANVRAEEAEQALEALRAETAPLVEIERCKRSIRAAGFSYGDSEETWYPHQPLGIGPDVGTPDPDWMHQFGETNQRSQVADWQAAERAAWGHAAEPYRKRIEAAGHELTLRFREPHLAPVELSLWQSFRGEEYPGYPTIALLEKAAIYAETHPRSAQWAEAHPANHSEPPKSRCPLCGKPFND